MRWGWYRARFSWTQRGAGMKPRQHSSWWWAVKWPARGSLGRWAACLLTPETLFMKGSSQEHCSPGQGTKGSEMLFCVEVAPPQHTPPSFFFSPFEPLLAVPLPPCLGGAMDGGDGLGTDSPGGAICAGVGSHWAEKLNIFN